MLHFLTFLLLHHDSVTEGQQLEELKGILVFLRLDASNEVMVKELELLVSVRELAEVHWLQSKNTTKVYQPMGLHYAFVQSTERCNGQENTFTMNQITRKH